jgi:hypothetical protein
VSRRRMTLPNRHALPLVPVFIIPACTCSKYPFGRRRIFLLVEGTGHRKTEEQSKASRSETCLNGWSRWA